MKRRTTGNTSSIRNPETAMSVKEFLAVCLSLVVCSNPGGALNLYFIDTFTTLVASLRAHFRALSEILDIFCPKIGRTGRDQGIRKQIPKKFFWRTQ